MEKNMLGENISKEEKIIENWEIKGYYMAIKNKEYKEIMNKIDILNEEILNCVSSNEQFQVKKFLQKLDELQNARSAVEFDETLKLIYKRYHKENK